MLRPRKAVDAAGRRARLDDLLATLGKEVDSSEPDPFDDAMVTAVNRLAEAMKAETDALADAETRLSRVAWKGSR